MAIPAAAITNAHQGKDRSSILRRTLPIGPCDRREKAIRLARNVEKISDPTSPVIPATAAMRKCQRGFIFAAPLSMAVMTVSITPVVWWFGIFSSLMLLPG